MERVIGSIYTNVSDDFQSGIYPIARCIKAEKHDLGVVIEEMNEVKVIGQMDNTMDNTFESANCVYDTDGIAPAMNTCGGGGLQPKILETVKIKQATKKGYTECELGGVADLSYPTSETRRGRVENKGQICPTLTASDNGICRIESRYRIRKLTPLECFRLMNFSDDDFHKAEEVNSNSQLYKQAGNSIVKVVLMAIMSQLNIKGVTPWNNLTIAERDGLSGKIKTTTTNTEDEENGIL